MQKLTPPLDEKRFGVRYVILRYGARGLLRSVFEYLGLRAIYGLMRPAHIELCGDPEGVQLLQEGGQAIFAVWHGRWPHVGMHSANRGVHLERPGRIY